MSENPMVRPPSRRRIHGIIHTASVAAGAIGAGLAQLPGSDAPVLVTIQSTMILALAKAHEKTLTQKKAVTLLAGLAATVTGRAVSQWVVGWIPGLGNLVNATTAATITEAIGWAANAYFAKKRDDEPEKS